MFETGSDEQIALERFRRLLRIETVTGSPEYVFAEYRTVFEECFPELHRNLVQRILPGGSLLYRWIGTNKGLAKSPLLILAHMDVVGAEASDASVSLKAEWGGHDPFAADIVTVEGEETIIARGAVDDKASQVAVAAAIERLLKAGFRPERDVFLFFGHDEEAGGEDGALRVANEFRRSGIRPALILDEGGAVSDDIFSGLKGPVAMVGIGEKGMLTLKLTVLGKGHSHSAAPSDESAPMLLAAAVHKLKGDIFPARLDPKGLRAGSQMLRHASLAMNGGVMQQLFKYARPLRGVLAPVMARDTETAAMVRTTVAVTQMESASEGFNVIANQGHAVVNFRIAPGSSIAETIAIVKATVGNDVVITQVESSNEPTSVSSIRDQAAKWLGIAVRRFYPGVELVPYVARTGADIRHFDGLGPCYRFMPFLLSKAQREALHGVGENIGVKNWLRGIVFFELLITVVTSETM